MLPTFQRFCDKLRYYAGDPKVIVEIGAMNCAESVDFAHVFPRAKIYAFECNPQTIPICRAAISSYPSVKLIERAVSEINGPVTFYPTDTARSISPHVDGNPGCSSLFLRNQEIEWSGGEKYFQNEITVQSVTLKSFMDDYGIAEIDALWLDAQGSELMILRSAGDRLRDVKVIQCEMEFRHEYLGQPLYPEVRAWLEEAGFDFVGWIGFWEDHAGDGLFVRRCLNA